ncbi:MAG: helix-turn-helix domain-containing protein [Eubacteriales bacterium]|nr:helix-turn-helix domain-containing protein [Eubacteriales bacterium]
MRLSMWILADWLSSYHPVCNIQTGEQILRHVRLLTDTDKKGLHESSVLLCQSQDYIPTLGNGVICVNQKDFLLLKTENVDEVYNQILEAFDFYNDWEYAMQDAILNNVSIEALIQLSSGIFRNPLAVTDSGHRILAGLSLDEKVDGWEEGQHFLLEHKFLPMNALAVIHKDLAGTENMRVPFFFTSDAIPYPQLLRNLYFGAVHIGWLMIWETRSPITQGAVQLCDYLGTVLEQWFSRNQTQEELSSIGMIFKRYLTGTEKETISLRLSMNSIGWSLEDPKFLIRMAPCSTAPGSLDTLYHLISRKINDGYGFLYEEQLVYIFNLKGTTQQELTAQLSRTLKAMNACGGASYIFQDLSNLKNYYEQAGIALSYSAKSSGTIAFCQDFIMDYVHETLKKNITLDILHPALQRLKQYDKKYHTDYYNTLYHFLLEERNQIRTAKLLHIHRNTLVHRILKIYEILDIDFENPDIRSHILLSYFLERK